MATLAERIANYEAAEARILNGQAYAVDGQSVQRASLETVQRVLKELYAQRDAETAAAAGVTPEAVLLKVRDPE